MSTGNKFKALSIFALIAFLAVPVFGATTGTLSISGNVPAILEITVSPAPTASTLPITTTVADSTIATVVERSNKKAGYTVTLQTANGGALKGAVSTDSLAYSLKYAGTGVTFSAGSATISNVSAKTSASGSSKVLSISFDGASAFLDEDSYSDTLTFTITAK